MKVDKDMQGLVPCDKNIRCYMPEYPDIIVYVERLKSLLAGNQLQRIRFANPFFLRTAIPPISSIEGLELKDIERLGKRVVMVF